MRIAIQALLLVLTACAGQGQPRDAFVDRVLEHLDTAWQSPPPQVQLDEQTAAVTLMRLERSKRLTIIHATVIHQQDDYTISDGDSIHVSVGTWDRDGDRLILKYYTLYRTIAVQPDDRRQAHEERASFSRNGDSISIHEKQFTISPVKAKEYDRVVQWAETAARGESQ